MEEDWEWISSYALRCTAEKGNDRSLGRILVVQKIAIRGKRTSTRGVSQATM
jgi:hypothetical protein